MLARSATAQVGYNMHVKLVQRQLCVTASTKSETATSAASPEDSTPTLWSLKSPEVAQPLTSKHTLAKHEKGLLLEESDVFCRRMARTWEVVAKALWTPGSKAEGILEEACGQQLFDRLVALRKSKSGFKCDLKVKDAHIVDYLEFMNVSDGSGSLGKK
jgi:hypothetical protein